MPPIWNDGVQACPAGTKDSGGCSEGICACEYVCSPACGSGELCDETSEGNVCSCHPALEGVPGDCRWTGLFASEVLDDCDPWSFAIFDNDLPSLAQVVDGTLHMAAAQRCQTIVAQTVARLPHAELFPDGAALVFDYTARGKPAEFQPQPTSLRFASTGGSLLPSEETQEYRLCVRLERDPVPVELRFNVEVYGTCDEVSPAELRAVTFVSRRMRTACGDSRRLSVTVSDWDGKRLFVCSRA